MTYDEAIDSRVSRDEAIAELSVHGFVADYEGAELFDCASGETIAMAGPDGDFAGSDVLAWLGY